MKRFSLPLLLTGLLLPALPAHAFDLDFNQVKSVVDSVSDVAKGSSDSSIDESQEIAIGRDLAARVIGAYGLMHDEALQRKLNRVGLWIALQSPRPNLPWHFVVLDTDEVNALAAPGGYVMVTKGMLKLVGNEAELACVVGHEIGHITRKHHINAMQKALITKGGTNLAATLLSAKSKNATGQYLIENGKEFAFQLVTLKLDRGDEAQADSDGVVFAAEAGYDPAACLSFMQHMAGDKDEEGLANLGSTHPAPSDRITTIQDTLANLQGATAGDGAKPPFSLATSGKKN